MHKSYPLAFLLILVLASCYPFGSFVGSGVLPNGSESVGGGIVIMTNAFSPAEADTADDASTLRGSAIMFRRGLGHNTEIGLRIDRLPWNALSLSGDVKWEFLDGPLPMALDMGISYWEHLVDDEYIGFHPALILGSEKLYVNIRVNHYSSRYNTYQIQELVLGREFSTPDSDYILTPLVGIHRNPEFPGDVYYSLGFRFQSPVKDWLLP